MFVRNSCKYRMKIFYQDVAILQPFGKHDGMKIYIYVNISVYVQIKDLFAPCTHSN